MKTKEFVCTMNESTSWVIAEEKGDFILLFEHGKTEPFYKISNKETSIDNGVSLFRNTERITLSDLKRVVSLLEEYLQTPLAERKEEKRYRLVSVSPMLRKSECGYLLYHKEYDKYYTGNTDHWGLVYQTIFTESEIAQMDITGFEKVEVEE